MKVSDLASELGVPPSAVLEQCQRFSIDATWAGAELNGTDVVILRAEMAGSEDALDLTEADEPGSDGEPPTDPPAAPVGAEDVSAVEVEEPSTTPDETEPVEAAPEEPAAKPAEEPAGEVAAEDTGPADLPPTAVGSIPGLIDEVTPEPEHEAVQTSGLRTGAQQNGPDPANGTRRVAPREAPAKKKLDRSARNAPIFLALALLLFAASNYVDNVFAVAAFWLLCLFALIAALVDSLRGRRHVQVHPEYLFGMTLSLLTLVLTIGGLVGLTTTVVTVVREQPASEAPLGIGDLASVQTARWGYQRVNRLADNGWVVPAREAGTCWRDNDKTERESERVEVDDGGRKVSCEYDHTIEVAKVFAVNRDADAPYPGADAIKALAMEKCGPTVISIEVRDGVDITMTPEYPTQAGWDDGDHDVSCLLITAARSGELNT